MTKFKTMIKKGLVGFAAVALIGGSSGAMTLALGQIGTVYAAQNVAPITDAVKVNNKDQITKNQVKAEYTLIIKTTADLEKDFKEKLGSQKGITAKQLAEQIKIQIGCQTPGTKDISGKQAATYAAASIKKVYGVDLKGYTAEPGFHKLNIPNSDVWAVKFKDPKNIQVGYLVNVNSVSGELSDISLRMDYGVTDLNLNKNMNDPSWKQKAVKDVSALLPSTVTVKNSKVISTNSIYGVKVLCELSDGSARVICLYGESKEITGYYVFSNGYDGSFDNTSN